MDFDDLWTVCMLLENKKLLKRIIVLCFCVWSFAKRRWISLSSSVKGPSYMKSLVKLRCGTLGCDDDNNRFVQTR